MKNKFILAACSLLLAASVNALASEDDAGHKKAQACAACHGADGNSQAPDFPRLAGQHYDYLARAMNDYKSGARKNPIMAPQAANLTTRDIDELATFFSKQKGLVVKY